jgi:NAD(P) transhydrogenase subunit alpha
LIQLGNLVDPLANLPITILATIAILVASINIVGGFVVTHRMLKMFKK